MKALIETIGWILFWGFVVVKVWGTSFAAWSWWWLLMVIIPWLALGVKHFNL